MIFETRRGVNFLGSIPKLAFRTEGLNIDRNLPIIKAESRKVIGRTTKYKVFLSYNIEKNCDFLLSSMFLCFKVCNKVETRPELSQIHFIL